MSRAEMMRRSVDVPSAAGPDPSEPPPSDLAAQMERIEGYVVSLAASLPEIMQEHQRQAAALAQELRATLETMQQTAQVVQTAAREARSAAQEARTVRWWTLGLLAAIVMLFLAGVVAWDHMQMKQMFKDTLLEAAEEARAERERAPTAPQPPPRPKSRPWPSKVSK